MRTSRLIRSFVRWRLQAGAHNKLANRSCRLIGAARTNYVWQLALATCGRAADWVRPRNFLVLSAVRSGTSLLVDLLNGHPRIRCRDEILNRDFGYYGNPSRMGRDRLRLHVASLFVKRPGIFAGAKVLTYQLDELQIVLADLIEILHRPQILVLYRQQTLEQFVSLKLAERDEVYHSTKPNPANSICLDPNVFLEFARRERRMWQENLSVLDGLPVQYLTYEQLAAETENSVRGVFEFLGLEPRSVQSPLVKLDPKPISGKVANLSDFLRPQVAAHRTLRLLPAEESPGMRVA